MRQKLLSTVCFVIIEFHYPFKFFRNSSESKNGWEDTSSETERAESGEGDSDGHGGGTGGGFDVEEVPMGFAEEI